MIQRRHDRHTETDRQRDDSDRHDHVTRYVKHWEPIRSAENITSRQYRLFASITQGDHSLENVKFLDISLAVCGTPAHVKCYSYHIITYKTRHTGTPAYLNRHLQPHHSTRQTRSSDIPLLVQPFSRTNFAKRSFRHSAPAVWNSLPRTVLDSTSLTVFKSRLKTHLFHLAYNSWFSWSDRLPTASEVTTEGGKEMRLLLLLLCGLLIDFDLLKAVTSTDTKPEVVFSCRGRHLDKAIWRYISAVAAPIWTKFNRLMQNKMQITGKWSRLKPGVEFQYGGRLFFQTRSRYMSAINWYMLIVDHWCRLNLVCW